MSDFNNPKLWPPVGDDMARTRESAHDRSDEARHISSAFQKNGGIKQEIKSLYTPPLDGTKDEVDRFDMTIARNVAETLVKHYPGYSWKVTAESKHGVVYFQIPELMGPTLQYVIKLGVFEDLTPKLIAACGGELLERMGLRRGAIDIGEYLAAKNAKEKFDFADVLSKGA